MNYLEVQGAFDKSSGSPVPLAPVKSQLHLFVDFVVRHRLLIAITMAVPIALAAWILFTATPIYVAESEVVLDLRSSAMLNVSPDNNQTGQQALPALIVSDQIAIISSRNLAAIVLDKLQLWDNPSFKPIAFIPYAIYDPRRWLGVTPLAAPPKTPAQLRDDTITNFMAGLSASPVGLSNAITIDYYSADPQLAALVANAYADAYANDQLSVKFGATKRVTEYLGSQVDKLAKQLDQAENAVEAYKAKTGLANKDGESIVEKQLADLNTQLTEATKDRMIAQAKYGQVSTGDLPSGYQQATDALRVQEAQVSQEMAQLSAKYQESHPLVIQARSKLASIRSEIANSRSQVIGSLRADYLAAQQAENTITAKIDELNVKANNQRQSFAGLSALEREVDTTQQLYQATLARLKEYEDRNQIQSPDARVISNATLPPFPSYPRGKALVFGALLPIAFGLGIILAYIVERLGKGFRTTEQAEQALALAYVSVVPQLERTSARSRDPSALLLAKPLSAYAEGVRSVQTALAVTGGRDEVPKVVLITSALPGEGKTTLAIGLARTMGKSGRKVVIVDFDLRHPNVAKVLTSVTKPKADIVDVLSGKASLEEAIACDSKSNLEFLGNTSTAFDAPEILSSSTIKKVLDDLRAKYDHIILDSAPILPVGDTRLIAQHVDKAVLAVRWEKTSRSAVVAAMDRLRETGASIATVVLNAADLRHSTALYGYSGGSGYQANYPV